VRGLRAFLGRLAGSFSAGKRDLELAEELESHIQMDAAELMKAGASAEEARRRAVLRLGGVDLTRERWRDRRGFPLLQEVKQDLRGAARATIRNPGFMAVTVLTLALGIGGSTAIFTAAHGVLIARLPFRDSDRLVALWEENAERPGRRNTVAPANFIRWTERATSFSGMTALYDSRVSLAGRARPEELIAQNVTWNFFATLGVDPTLGRAFAPDEGPDGHDAVTVLSHGAWRRYFDGDPAIVGRSIRINGRPVTVVGVAPRGFGFVLGAGALVGKPPDLWMPIAFGAASREPRGRYLSAFARIRDGTSFEQAAAEMHAIAAGLEAELPRFDRFWTARLFPIRNEISGDMKPALLMLSGAVAFVLLIVCVNVANLLLARGMSRRSEMAVRAALGAGRARVVRQLLTENVLLAGLGGLAGWWIARGAVALLVAAGPVDATVLARIHFSGPVLLFAILISAVTVLVAGLVPAFESSREGVAGALKEASPGAGTSARARRLRRGLVVTEVALASVLLVGAGLLLRSFARASRVDPGFDPRGILTARVTLHGGEYEHDERVLAFFRGVVSRTRSLPGVRSAGAISYLPMAGLGASTDFEIVGRPQPPPGQEPGTDVGVCDNGFFEAMRIPLRKGRLFEEREMRVRSNVVVVNETFARTYFPKGDAIGQRVVIHMSDDPLPSEIVGIVGDLRQDSITSAVQPAAYWPHPQLVYSAMTFVVRSDGDPGALASPLRQVVHALDGDQPVADVRTMEQWVASSLARARFTATLLSVFAALALTLAAIGIYGVLSYVVGQRRSEFGIRMALGASDRTIRRMVVAGGTRLVVAGLAIGVPVALALSGFLSSLLFETSKEDPATLAAAVVTLGLAAAAASAVPAWRASRVEPVEALKSRT
jgi:putative ABC transport system permease protein